jgi:lysozyme family protein
MNFDTAFALLLGHEGDYTDDTALGDRGGKTRFGITEAVARQAGYTGDMRELPVDLAKRIYLDSYWRPVRADDLPPGVRYIVFDGAVNSGPAQSALWLQRALGVTADGVIGPRTLAAAYAKDAQQLKTAILAQRLRFMTSLTNWPAFSRGWARRIADLMEA